MTAEGVAQAFHGAYERLAPEHGYRTREASAKPWTDVPADNKALMTATVVDLMERKIIAPVTADGEISDGHHTFGELYAHRRALTAVLAAAAASQHDAWRSKAHHPDDDPMFDSYFIVGIELPFEGPVTYHYELKYWDDFAATPEREHAPKWDGATPGDTVTRLLAVARRVAAA